MTNPLREEGVPSASLFASYPVINGYLRQGETTNGWQWIASTAWPRS
jgi:hypothetical protein